MRRSALFSALLCALFATARADTTVSGPIRSTTWTKSASPYRVTGEVTVPPGDTLTIEPGVDVLFDADVAFRVQGRLSAIGTEVDSVRFTRGTTQWRGLYFERSAPGDLRYVRINGSNSGGMTIASSVVRIVHGVIDGNRKYAYTGYASTFRLPVWGASDFPIDIGARGGGIEVVDGGSVTLDSCAIRGNSPLSWYLWGNMTRHFVFTSVGGAIFVGRGCRATLRNTTLSANRAYLAGGALYADSATVTATNCRFLRNIAPHGMAEIGYDNSVGGMFVRDWYPAFAAAYTQGSDALFVNCTFAGNASEIIDAWMGGSYGPVGGDPAPAIVNTIVRGNKPATPTYVKATYSDIALGDSVATGAGNINVDPLFADSITYVLAPGSPCIDAGDPDGPRDRDGSVADMGVSDYETIAPQIELIDSLVVRAGDPAPLYLANHGTADLAVTTVDLPADFTTTTAFPIILGPGGSVAVPISYAGLVDVVAAATVRSDDPDRPEITVSLRGLPLTHISGTIGDTVWTKENSPYRIVGPVEVAAGRTLTIEPGVDVLFDGWYPLGVRGRVRAIGTASDSIRFLPGLAKEWNGVRITGGDSSSFAYVRISGGLANSGGGMHISGAGTRVRLTHSVISGNRGYYEVYNSFYGWNEADGSGGGLALASSARAELLDCRVINNRVGIRSGAGLAILVGAGCTLEMTGCEIARNGVAGSWTYSSRLPNTVRFEAGSAGNITNCTITGLPFGVLGLELLIGVNNTPPSLTDTTVVTVRNSVVWQRGVRDPFWLFIDDAMSPNGYRGPVRIEASYCLLPAPFPGTGNIVARPMFADSAGGDFSLAPGSPAIDAGDPASPRDPDDSRADIGAIPSPYGTPLAIGPTVTPPPFALYPAAPNPFNPSTAIRFSLPAAGDVRLAVYDVNGRHVRALADGPLNAGPQEVVWDGRDASGRPCASGVYIYRLTASDGALVRRMVLVR